MKVYISSRYKEAAKLLAKQLKKAGHEVTSSWLRARNWPKNLMKAAVRNLRDIAAAEALVLISDDSRSSPGGKFVEAGYALGLGLHVLCLGSPENILMHHAGIWPVADSEDLLSALECK